MSMTDSMNEPISTHNLDQYGSAALPWSRPRDVPGNDTPQAELTFFVATVRPDGRPHSAGVGAAWVDGALYFVGGPGTRRSRNLAANPACSVSVRLRGIDLVLEGEAHRVTDSATLEHVGTAYRSGGWPAEVEGDALTAPYSAPSAGPPVVRRRCDRLRHVRGCGFRPREARARAVAQHLAGHWRLHVQARRAALPWNPGGAVRRRAVGLDGSPR